MRNSTDAAFLRDPSFHRLIAEAIGAALVVFLAAD
ncbi:hypothetical protein BH23ACT5_BH23ACT5_10140 [soil metagenome]